MSRSVGVVQFYREKGGRKFSKQRNRLQFTWCHSFWTVHLVNIFVKNQQKQQLLMQFISYVW
jgi:hypothetical protein